MAAVELSDRQQVQRGDEQPEPSCECDRIEIYVDGRRIDAQHQVRETEEQDRVAQLETASRFIQRRHVGKIQTDDDGGYREHHARPRAGRANVEHHAASARRRSHPDERAEGPDDEVGQGGIDAVVARGQVVAHLVREQNHHQGNRERESRAQRRNGEKGMGEGDHLAIHVRAGGGGGQESQQEQSDIERRDSRRLERAIGRLHRSGVARNISKDRGSVLVCGYFIHD